MEVITMLNSPEDVAKAYEDAGVNQKRQDSLFDNYSQLPSKFKVFGLTFVTLTIGEKVLKNVPAFAISEDGKQTVLVGTFKQSYTDKTEAVKIKKEGKNKGKFMVVNNKRVHPFAVNKSEADLVVSAKGKTFITQPSQDFNVFVPTYKDNSPQYAETADEAMGMITNKSYSIIELLG